MELLYGSLILLIGVSLTSSIGLGITCIASLLPLWAGILLQAFFLKLTISLRGLDQAAKKVQDALQNENLPEARRLLSWHLVSRDTSTLSQSQVSAAAIESVAENTSDELIDFSNYANTEFMDEISAGLGSG